MKVVVIGTGYVGLVTGACLAELGINVVCVDKDNSRIAVLIDGGCPIHEDKLPELIVRNTARGRLIFTADMQDEIGDCDIVFICVDTPRGSNSGAADLSNVYTVVKGIASGPAGIHGHYY